MNSIIERAKWLAHQGIGVYPFNHENGKPEAMPVSGLRIYTKENDVEALFASHPHKGLMAFTGLRQFGNSEARRIFAVFDVDEESQLDRVKYAFGDWLKQCLLEKGTKGMHICFFTDAQVKTIRKDKTFFGDVMGATDVPNIIFMAPSISHKNGKEYTIIEDRDIGFIPSDELLKIYENLNIANRDEKTEAAYTVQEGPVAEVKARITPEMIGLHYGSNMECPLHKHNNARNSLHVTRNPEGSFFWYCYADNDGGDCLKAYMLLHKCDFKEALNVLAEKAGIEINVGVKGYVGEENELKKYFNERGEQMLGFFIRTEVLNSDSPTLQEVFVHTDRGAYIALYTPTKDGGVKRKIQQIINGEFRIGAKVEYLHDEKMTFKWKIFINGKEHTSELDGIVDFIMSTGAVVGVKEFARQFISLAIRSSNVRVIKTYCAAGLYWDTERKMLVNASTTESVMPELDSQERYLAECIKYHEIHTEAEEKELMQASFDLIRAMPKCNRLPSLIIRGFSLLAPLSYEIRKSRVSVFPYLYLYGTKGSSKTHMADCCSTFIYTGSGNHLNSNSVGSAFRLGQEFAATTFPRNIDEAHDVFIKNIEIFKDAATSTLATKRGGTNMKMTTYPSYSSFILTSNAMPIDAEADVGGGLMDRIIVLKMDKGKDFNQEMYSSAHMKVHMHGRILGDIFIKRLETMLNTIGMDVFCADLLHIAEAISTKHEMPIRRATAIAEMCAGIKLYLRLLADYSIDYSEVFNSDKVQDEAIELMASIHKEAEKDFIRHFLDWVDAVLEANSFDGVDGRKYSYGKIQLEGIDLGAKHESIILTKTALLSYAKRFNIKNMNIKTMPELADELLKVGYMEVEPTNHKTALQGIKYGVRIPRKLVVPQQPSGYEEVKTEQDKQKEKEASDILGE